MLCRKTTNEKTMQIHINKESDEDYDYDSSELQ